LYAKFILHHGHQLHQSLRADGGNGERVERRLGLNDGVNEVGVDAELLTCFFDQIVVRKVRRKRGKRIHADMDLCFRQADHGRARRGLRLGRRTKHHGADDQAFDSRMPTAQPAPRSTAALP
jgi:hypothetical protein